MKLFAPTETRPFAEAVADHLGQTLSPLQERTFDDGEQKIGVKHPVRDQDAYVLQSLYDEPGQSVNDKLVRLLFLIHTLKDSGARRVTAMIPYLAYARQDRATNPRDPVTHRYVAQMLEAAGTDAVVTLDVHNLAAYQNAFRCPAWNLDTRRIFVDHLCRSLGSDPIAVASPDVGGVKRAQLFRDILMAATGQPTGFAFMEKRRTDGILSGSMVVGDVTGATVLIVDDMVASGGTMARASDAFLAQGARRILCVATHGLFVGQAAQVVGQGSIDRWMVTDTIPLFRLPADLIDTRIDVLSVAPLFARAIRCLHTGGSLTEVLEGPA